MIQTVAFVFLSVGQLTHCTATEMIPTIEMIPATEMIPTTEMIPAVTEMIPGISGVELRGLQKLDNNLVRAFYLFVLHLFYGM